MMVLILGLILPSILFRIEDAKMARAEWAVENTGETYSYSSTLENRVCALSAYQNGSPWINSSAAGEALSRDIWNELYEHGLLPVANDSAEYTVSAFKLTPAQMNTEYAFVDATCISENNTLHTVWDVETGTVLRLDFTCNAELLQQWMKNTGEGFDSTPKYYTLVQKLASFNQLGAISDSFVNYTNGETIQSFEANVVGTYFAVSVKYSLEQGLLMYSVSAQDLL